MERDAKDILDREAREKAAELYWWNYIPRILVSPYISAVKTWYSSEKYYLPV